ncbi:hypothetical protein I204_04051 [Kwoniella mangroviensis CBS 8886]|nr:hypothetical protein I204_04051 [Kwoniella mangroviensis CBS 8886]
MQKADHTDQVSGTENPHQMNQGVNHGGYSLTYSITRRFGVENDSLTMKGNSAVSTTASTKRKYYLLNRIIKPGSSMSSKGSKRKAEKEIPDTTSSETMASRRSRRGDTGVKLFQLEFDDEDNDDNPMMAAQSKLESRSQDEAGMTQNEVDVLKESVTTHTESGSGSIKRKRGRPPLSEDEKKEREHHRQMRNLFIRK